MANPLGALLACGGLAAYGLAVSAQWLQTGKLHPFPLTSKTADESDEELSASTVTGGSLQIARSHIHEEASYLEPREKAEYELLHHAPQGLLNAVSSVAPAQRWACYCFLLDAHRTGNLDDYRDRATLETVLGNSSVYHSHLPEAVERFPEIGLDSATAQPPSLPGAHDALPAPTSSPIGNNTRLGAIEVPVSQSRPPTQNEATAPTQPMDNVSVLSRAFQQSDAIGLPNELIQTMVETPYSNFVIGMSGAGKDILVHSVMKAIRAKYPQATIIGIDGKGAMKERPMWDSAIYNETVHFSMADHPHDYHPRLKHIFDRVDSLPPHSFVVFSEVNGTRDSYIGNGMGRQWQEISSKIRYLVLQGKGSKYDWNRILP